MSESAGFFWDAVKQLINSGLSEYLYSTYNVLNCIMNILYVASYSLHYYTMIVVNVALSRLESEDFWSTISQLNASQVDEQKDVYQTFYWLNQGERFCILTSSPSCLSTSDILTAFIRPILLASV